MFAKYDKKGDGTLTLAELFQLMHGNRNVADPFGVSNCRSREGYDRRKFGLPTSL